MASLLEVIKQAGVDAVGATNPVAVMFGTVTKASPLEVNVDQRFTLTEDFLVIPESLMMLRNSQGNFNMSLKGNVLTGPAVEDESEERWTGSMRIYGAELEATRGSLQLEPFSVGDKLILLRIQGGQKYVVLDRVWGG